MTIDVDISDPTQANAYFLLCGDFVADDGSYRVNYDNCQLRTTLQQGKYAGRLKMTSSTTRLLAVLIDFNSPSEQYQVLWERQLAQEDILTIR